MRLLGRVVGHGLLIFWTCLTLIPFILIAILSLRSTYDIYAHPLGIGGAYHFGNYPLAWRGPTSGTAGMGVYFRNTLIAAGVAVGVNLSAGSLAAFFATRLSPRKQTWFLRMFLVGTVVPLVLLIVPYFKLYSAFGLLESPAALGIAYAATTLPATVLILYAHFADFPASLIEAGKLDGLGDFAIYVRLVMPLSKGALATVAMILLVAVWNEAQLAIVLLQDSYHQTVAVGMLAFQGTFISELGPMFAGLTLASLPVIVFYLIFSKSITRGIALGGFFR